MSEKNTFWRRRRFIVDKPFQYALLRLLVALWVFFTALQGWFMHYLYSGPVFDYQGLLNQPDVKIIANDPPQFSGLLVLAATMSLIVVVSVGVHLSHKVAGPIFRVKESLRRVTSGEINFAVHFREGDYLGEVEELFNETLRALRERAENDIDRLKAAEAMLPEDAPARIAVERLRRDKEVLLETAEIDPTSEDALGDDRLESARPVES